ncbi:GDYXXLXY domain-containing protein [Erythrobacter sp. CCH5-A1]|jgi:uncharacterized membrane-anchored protein|uniref:GDYXXLXY domain-containing protein n=1 Tax=Erythrobacter sp. CCH5-A1 TaxID=1768792 RepID=UPI0008362C2B|nr:GDYXXLXY domain-containing protein [Erythrobacter sp. CCH5-A1]
MTRAARLAAAALPLLGLGALWAQSDRTYHKGTDWEVPAAGYDPRDYLRGHYVVFTYDWPLDKPMSDIGRQSICLEGEAPDIRLARVLAKGEACDHPLREDAHRRLTDGRLYIGQARAAQIEEELRNRDQRGIVTIRQREDGSFTPISIRFRPLTPAEIAERDAPEGEAPLSPFDPLGAPAVMDK